MNWQEFSAEIPGTKTIGIEPYEGESAVGEIYGPLTEITPCVLDSSRRQVKTQTSNAAGAVVISSATAFCPPGTVAPPKSRVTLPDGTVTRVITRSDLDDHGLDLPSHVELALE